MKRAVSFPAPLPEYQQPIMAGVYKVAGWIIGVGGVILALITRGAMRFSIFAVAPALISIFLGLVTYGVGQVIDLTGKTAFFSEQSHTLLAAQFEVVNRRLAEIEAGLKLN